MGFNNPFRAAPLAANARARRKERERFRGMIFTYLGSAVAGGVAIGIGSVAFYPEGRERILQTLKPIAVAGGIVRARAPQAGDSWRGCDDARAAGTAPIYRGEPGYRSEMDGDGDGEACEPWR